MINMCSLHYNTGMLTDLPRKSFESILPNFFCARWMIRPVRGSRVSGRPDPAFSVYRDLHYYKSHKSCWNAYLRKVHGETVIITHPCHPFYGHSVDVLHFQLDTQNPSIMVEFPDGTARNISVSCKGGQISY